MKHKLSLLFSIILVVILTISISSTDIYTFSEPKSGSSMATVNVIVHGCDNCNWVKYCINAGEQIYVYGTCEFKIEVNYQYNICVQCYNGKIGYASNVDPTVDELNIYVRSDPAVCDCNYPRKK